MDLSYYNKFINLFSWKNVICEVLITCLTLFFFLARVSNQNISDSEIKGVFGSSIFITHNSVFITHNLKMVRPIAKRLFGKSDGV